jgi:hypothetical protein
MKLSAGKSAAASALVLLIVGLSAIAASALNNGQPWTVRTNLVTASSCRTPFIHAHAHVKGNATITLTPQRSSHDSPSIAATVNVRQQRPNTALTVNAADINVVNGKIIGCSSLFLATINTDRHGNGSASGSTDLPQGDNTQIVRLVIANATAEPLLVSPSSRI